MKRLGIKEEIVPGNIDHLKAYYALRDFIQSLTPPLQIKSEWQLLAFCSSLDDKKIARGALYHFNKSSGFIHRSKWKTWCTQPFY